MQPANDLRSVSAGALATGIAACLLAHFPAAAQPALRVAQAPADLVLDGPLRIGDRSVEWGGIVRLDPAGAIRNQAGHCRFPYRYRVTNDGPGAAGAHVNRLRLEGGQALAEDAVAQLASAATRSMDGTLTLWSGEVVVYVELDAGRQVDDLDRSNNLRRIRADVGEGCPDPRPRARPPIQPGAGPAPRHPVQVPMKTSDADQEPVGPRARPPVKGRGSDGPRPVSPPTASRGSEPARSGNRAPPPQGRPAAQRRPAPGSTSKPIPEDELHCRPRLTVERSVAASRAGALATATTAWRAKALELHGPGFPWNAARDQTTQCSFGFGWSCTVSARPCRS